MMRRKRRGGGGEEDETDDVADAWTRKLKKELISPEVSIDYDF